jgi:hypothetical protein
MSIVTTRAQRRELERQNAKMPRDCAAVLRTIDPDDSDEAEKLADLLGAIDGAIEPSRHKGALL